MGFQLTLLLHTPDDDDYYDGEDGAEQLTAAGAAQLERLDGLLRGADDDDDPGDDERRIGRAAVTNGRSNGEAGGAHSVREASTGLAAHEKVS